MKDMPYVDIDNNNVVRVVATNNNKLRVEIEMSLQRHHYLYCHLAEALPINSLMYHSVAKQEVRRDAMEVGNKLEDLFKQGMVAPAHLYEQKVKVTSGRIYKVDNVAQNPRQMVNHFFPISGPQLWQQMRQEEYIVIREIRRVAQEIEKKNYRVQQDYKKWEFVSKELNNNYSGSGLNPVIASYRAAVTNCRINRAVLDDCDRLIQVSGEKEIVIVLKQLIR
ncbi:hypothetical protein [Anabaena lutea]|uniref:Uncharacterized protein n=1 Tax=Anabaena lutea FACHB-196 TaxID=2692881 RepID=A0ABR8FHY1_9NOST|nr:hypothetical protein [Anabaena lutea]MBD2569840.1 hypothetical protein [Anabaena lutea FACHB-196]